MFPREFITVATKVATKVAASVLQRALPLSTSSPTISLSTITKSSKQRTLGGISASSFARVASTIPALMVAVMLIALIATPSRADAFLFFGNKKTKDAAYYLHKADIHLERRGRIIWRPLAISEYQKALALSNTVVDAKRSQLGIGNGYIKNKEYANAISAYQVYLEFYKLDYDSPQVIYNLGLAYHKLYKGKGRRVDYQQQALVAFAELQKTYPEFYRNSDAAELEVISTNRLLDNEIHVASLYIRLKEFASAAIRLENTSVDYPDSKSLPQAQFLLAKAYYNLGDMEGYDQTVELLKANWTKNKYTKKAEKLQKK